MPTDAVIPSTPLSLLPFLNKINEQWSSDLETPQTQSHVISTINTTVSNTFFLINFVTLMYCYLQRFTLILKDSNQLFI